MVTKSRKTVLLRAFACPACTATPTANVNSTPAGSKRSHGLRGPNFCTRAARPKPEAIANSRSDSIQNRPRMPRKCGLDVDRLDKAQKVRL